jgi:hypothetical protein
VLLPSTHRAQIYLGGNRFYEVHSIHDICLIRGNISAVSSAPSLNASTLHQSPLAAATAAAGNQVDVQNIMSTLSALSTASTSDL